MASSYTYKRQLNTTKKISGIYDADAKTISSDENQWNLVSELADFDGALVTLTVSVKSEEDLADGGN